MNMMQVGSVALNFPGPPEHTHGDISRFKQVKFPTPFPARSEVIVVPMVQTFNGADTPGLRIAEVTNKGFKIRLNELVAKGGTLPLSDGGHTKETIGWVAFTV